MPISTTWIVVAVVVALAVFAIVMFNRLDPRAQTWCARRGAASTCNCAAVQDLIPNLVETVKAYAGHERGVFDDITTRRAASVAAQGVAQTASSETRCRVRSAGCWRLPKPIRNSKADQNFLKLQTEFSAIEDELQMARRYYNGTVRDFNIAIQTFPDVLIAHAAGMHEEHFFETDAASRIAPTVSLFRSLTMTTLKRIAIAAALLLCAAFAPAHADERITRFVSDCRRANQWRCPGHRDDFAARRGRDHQATASRATSRRSTPRHDGTEVEVAFDVLA